jgi:tetrahydromethanopterin S-methyltransferase subunit C
MEHTPQQRACSGLKVCFLAWFLGGEIVGALLVVPASIWGQIKIQEAAALGATPIQNEILL